MDEVDIDLHKLRAVIFDLDGTLLDSYPVHFRAYQHTFSRFGIELNEADFLATYSPNWLDTYRALGLPEEVWEEADTYWLEAASQTAPALFPGVLETLDRLRGSFRLGLVTSGSRERVYRDLRERQLQDYFETIVTGDDVKKPKPDPDGLLQALAALRVTIAEAVYVGDSSLDREMSSAAGVKFIGIQSRFASLGADTSCYMLASLSDLPALLAAK